MQKHPPPNQKPERILHVLVACESSGVVSQAFRDLGHIAWSCDLLPTDGDPNFHIQGDVLAVLQGRPIGWSSDRPWFLPKGQSWDLIIGHPPCTYLSNSGVRWLFDNPTWRGGRPTCRLARIATEPSGIYAVQRQVLVKRNANEDRVKAMKAGAEFFCKLYCANAPYIAIENPIMHCYGKAELGRRIGTGNVRPTQIIQPWQFGHGETKATCLWLRNLPKLVPTDIVAGREQRIWRTPPGPDRWKIRSKTFEGIAKAMATQWSAHILAEKQKGNN